MYCNIVDLWLKGLLEGRQTASLSARCLFTGEGCKAKVEQESTFIGEGCKAKVGQESTYTGE